MTKSVNENGVPQQNCPMCGGSVSVYVEHCHHCKKDFSKKTNQSGSNTLVLLLVPLAILIAFLLFYTLNNSRSQQSIALPPPALPQTRGSLSAIRAWNSIGVFTPAERNTINDEEFQKKVVELLMNKGLGSITKMTDDNQGRILDMVTETANQMGATESMVAFIAQTKAGVSGVAR